MNGATLDQERDRVSASARTTLAARMEVDSEFAAWMEREYRPIAGGWQY